MVKLWDVSSGVLQHTFEADHKHINQAAFSPDSQQLVLVDHNTINLWTISSWSLQQSMKGTMDSYGIHSLAFSHDGKLLASATSYVVELWDTTKGGLQHTFRSQLGSVFFSPDSKLLALACFDAMQVWTTDTGTLQSTLQEDSRANAIAFLPNGRNLIYLTSSAEPSMIKVWDASSGNLQHSLEGNTDPVQHLAISPDGELLASVSYKGTLMLWDTSTWALQQTTMLLGYGHHKLYFHPTKPFLIADRILIWTKQSERCDTSMSSKRRKTLCVTDDWITLDGENLLYLPLEYYTCTMDFQAGLLALGHVSGRISILGFDLTKLEQL